VERKSSGPKKCNGPGRLVVPPGIQIRGDGDSGSLIGASTLTIMQRARFLVDILSQQQKVPDDRVLVIRPTTALQ
jgi:hypothetical protein